ncbi:hypothetical protein [Pontibacter populi]|uniref:Uncharacterized protein n=1 Tax=Pontibacter populi TaxID=890055 RepID=A0ABV1RVS3_9BACT
MLKLKKRIDGYLKYPLMWVMLLWAFTMPGHEVRVYNFLFKALVGEPVAELTQAREEISRSEKQPNFAYQEATPAASVAGKLKLQLPGAISDSFLFSPGQPVPFFSFSGYSYRAAAVQEQLLIALLPNAP